MKKNNLILSAALAAVFSTSAVFAEAEVTGKIVHESAKFTESGTSIGATTAHGKDNLNRKLLQKSILTVKLMKSMKAQLIT